MKYGCILILFALSRMASGQTLGIIGRPDILNVKYSYQNANIKTLPQMGFHLGMALENDLSNNLAFGTGIIFTEKGFREDYEIPTMTKQHSSILTFQPNLPTCFMQIKLSSMHRLEAILHSAYSPTLRVPDL